MFSRPEAKETESDLLRFQEQFLAGRLNPSAAVVRSNAREEPRASSPGDKRDSPCGSQVERDVVTFDGLPAVQPSSRFDPGLPPKKKSRFKTRRQDANTKEQGDEADMDCAELLDTVNLLGEGIGEVEQGRPGLAQYQMEREIPHRSFTTPRVSERGFPMALHRGNIDEQALSPKGTNSDGRKSLFAQQFAASGAGRFGVPKQNDASQNAEEKKHKIVRMDPSTPKFPKPSLISGEGLVQHAGKKTLLNKEVEEIHDENIAKLESMTQEEILEEQARIRASLDPSLLAFLTSRRQRSEGKTTEAGLVKEKGVACGDIKNSSVEVESGHDEKHVHFSDNVEMITQENGQEIPEVEQSDGGIKIGDVQVSDKWLHMGTLESEKLEWMKDCPTPSAVESKQGNQARFDFDGCVVTKTDDIPEYLGLHHHGDDPSSPGYTLEELFILARSSFLQQRVFALQVLARIIRQDQMGAFQSHLHGDVLSVLLDAGVLFLLRWSLDDTSDGVVAAAIQGFAAVLIVPSDKESVDKQFSFSRGQELPTLCPNTENKEHKTSSEDDAQEKSLTDAELLKQDAVKGLIQMNLLPRLRYILEVCHPAAPTVQDVLDILTRISQHSTQTANKVIRCPRLMEAIFANFLPLSWKTPELKTGAVAYGQPVTTAMRLVRTICCAGRHMAATLISKYHLTDRLMRYTALSPRNMQVELQEAYSVYTESLRTWRVCILYGLGCDAVREMYATFVEHLQSIQCLSILLVTPEHKSELSCAAAIFGVIEASLHAAGATADQTPPEQHHGMDSLPPLALNWSHVTGFLPLIGGCVTKWVKEILDFDPCPTLRAENLCLLSGAVTALTAYYSKLCDQVSYSPVDTLQELEQLSNTVLLPLVESQFLDWCFTQISAMSAYSNNRGSKLFRKAIPSLPDFGSLELIEKRGPHPAESNFTELMGVTSSLMQLLYHVTKLHKGIATKFCVVLCKSSVRQYLNLAVESQDAPLSFFVRQEHHLQYFLLKLASNLIEGTESDEYSSYILLWHEAALSLFSKIFPGDEFYAFDLLSTILFNAKFFCAGNGPSSVGVTKDLSEMSLTTPPLPSTCDTSAASRGELIAKAHKNLPCIRSTFMGSFQGMKHPLETSRLLSLHQVRNIQSFLIPSCVGPLQPADWMFLPIVDLHNQAISVEMKGQGIDTIRAPAVSIVTTTLQLVLLLEEWRPSCLRHVSMASRIARLMCVFLTGNDLFLNSSVHDYLSALLRIYTNPSKLNHLDFNSPIPGLTSFYDLYASLLSQYSAVSFGDALFGCYVILPLAQRHDFKFRRAVWDEHIGVLRALSIPSEQLPIPLEEFLYPVEQNHALLALYLRALATQTVRLQWSPLLYLVAVHHVNAFIFQRVDPEDEHGLKNKITLLKQVLAVQNEDVRHDVLYYYKPSPSSSSEPFVKFTNLPADRQLLLRNRDELEECRKIYQTMESA